MVSKNETVFYLNTAVSHKNGRCIFSVIEF